jgi:hypothetical protein
MKGIYVQGLDTGQRVQGFLTTEAAAIGPIVPAPLRAQLDDAVTQLASSELAQGAADAAARGETTKQLGLRDGVYTSFVGPIGATAKKKLATASELPALVVPAKARHTKAFVALASAAATAAALYTQVFIDNGLPADFIAQLQAGLTQITDSANTRARQLGLRSAATAGLVAADKELRDAIDSLNRILAPALKSKPTLLADWVASKKIRAVPVTPLPGGSATVPSTGATPAPATPTATPTSATAPAPAAAA